MELVVDTEVLSIVLGLILLVVAAGGVVGWLRAHTVQAQLDGTKAAFGRAAHQATAAATASASEIAQLRQHLDAERALRMRAEHHASAATKHAAAAGERVQSIAVIGKEATQEGQRLAAELERARDKANAYAVERDYARKDADEARAEIAALTRDARQAEKEREKLDAKLTRAEEKLARAEAELRAARDDARATLEVRRADLQNERAQAGAKVRGVEAERDRLDQAHRMLQREFLGVQERGRAVADRYVKDTAKRAEDDVTSVNLHTVKARLHKVAAFCAAKGFSMPQAQLDEIDARLVAAYEEAVRREFAREEQRLIRERIREEAKAERERQKEIERLEQEEARIQIALERALSKARGEHDAEVDRLRALLTEAEAKAQRAKSQAQMTRAGFVYVISNVGSFGDGVFKVGMTRRLEPLDRVTELGDASVPFPFDVHMMISCEDAPKLETAMHRSLNDRRVNKVNLRKEFFRASVDEIAALVETHHGKVEYRATPEALEFNETRLMDAKGEAPEYDPAVDELPEEGDDPGREPQLEAALPG